MSLDDVDRQNLLLDRVAAARRAQSRGPTEEVEL